MLLTGGGAGGGERGGGGTELAAGSVLSQVNESQRLMKEARIKEK